MAEQAVSVNFGNPFESVDRRAPGFALALAFIAAPHRTGDTLRGCLSPAGKAAIVKTSSVADKREAETRQARVRGAGEVSNGLVRTTKSQS